VTMTVWGEEPLLIGGIIPITANRAFLFSYLSRNIGKHFSGVTRLVEEFLSLLPVKRIEAGVDIDYPQAHRWLKIMGFTMETPRAEAYNWDGSDASLYVKIKR